MLVFSSVALFFNGCISGWGWLVPYNLQPSYHKFKKMCKLNELPNNEEKYNKILSYYDLDWNTMLETMKPMQTSDEYQIKYMLGETKIHNRIEFDSGFFVYLDKTKQNIVRISPYFFARWDTKRKYLTTKSIASYELVFKTAYGSCTSIKD
ncbi:hypothetical protein [Helicobacter trogontum]|uniref:hypothetical protein n=1 Tax=Helicobacter trogontum TaxID=50960 RepID=UPI001F1A8A7E|nr:hypothetical protein [Helicobacter trogontum]